MQEAYVKKYRKKPMHKKLVRKRSVLRNGTELRSFSDFMSESTARTAPPGAYSNDAHEINWLKDKIKSFEPEYTAHMKSRGERHGTKPRRHREILELEKQMREKGGTPDNHSWIKRD